MGKCSVPCEEEKLCFGFPVFGLVVSSCSSLGVQCSTLTFVYMPVLRRYQPESVKRPGSVCVNESSLYLCHRWFSVV